MSLVVTVLDAEVAPERTRDLQDAYTEAAQGPFPAGFVRSTLLRLTNEPTLWRIETIWQSHEALAAMRQVGKPRGLQIFEAAGAHPTLTVLDAVAEVVPSTGAA
jgi:hypothetical protein